MQDQELGDLCREAMHEKDVNKLLMILLELDRATEGEHSMEVLQRPSESTGKMNWKETGQTDRGAESLDSIILRITAGQTGFLSGGCLARGYHPLH